MVEEIITVSVVKNDTGAPNVILQGELLRGTHLQRVLGNASTGELTIVLAPVPDEILEAGGVSSEFVLEAR